jgi:FkbM family methyltransferase
MPSSGLERLKRSAIRNLAGWGFVRPYSLYSMALWSLRGIKINGIVDGGAYDGAHSLQLSALFPTADVYAFEPLEARFQQLTRIAKTNSRIIPINMALSDSSGDKILNCNKLDATSSFLETSEASEARDLFDGRGDTLERKTVRTTTLDDYAETRQGFRCDLLKLDVQGSELPALLGATRTLKTTSAVVAEIRFKPAYRGDTLFREIDAFLGSEGLRLRCITEVTHQPRDASAFEANALWCRDS